jgi:hypothetical protein
MSDREVSLIHPDNPNGFPIVHVKNALDEHSFNRMSNYLFARYPLPYPERAGEKMDVIKQQSDTIFNHFAKLFNDIQLTLKTELGKTCKLTGICVFKNMPKGWHVHFPEFMQDDPSIFPEKFWLSTSYMHQIWDADFGGDLNIGTSIDQPQAVIPCLPNSYVISKAHYGHGVKFLDVKDGKMDRIAVYCHWLEVDEHSM